MKMQVPHNISIVFQNQTDWGMLGYHLQSQEQAICILSTPQKEAHCLVNPRSREAACGKEAAGRDGDVAWAEVMTLVSRKMQGCC